MLKRIILIPLFVFIFPCLNSAQDFSAKEEKLAIYPARKTLKEGEKLRYSVSWLGFSVGKITLSIEAPATILGKDCFHLKAEATPNNFFKKFFDVSYEVHSYIDKTDLFTQRFEKTRRVGKDYTYLTVNFDRKWRRADVKVWGSGSVVRFSAQRQKMQESVPVTLDIAESSQDLISSIYYFRTLDVRQDSDYPINIYYDRRNWKLNAKVGKPFIRDIYKKGSFPVFEVAITSDLGAFIMGKRKFFVYFSTDQLRIPLEFKLLTAIGPFRGIIQEIPQ